MPVTATLCREPIDVAVWTQGLYRKDCGAVNLFLGVVRDHHQGRAVSALEYEAYEGMALKQLARIGAEVVERFGLARLVVVHRIGALVPGDVSLFVGVSAHHRKESLAATACFIDRLKQDVPIWKKETFSGGEVSWVDDCCSEPSTTSQGVSPSARPLCHSQPETLIEGA